MMPDIPIGSYTAAEKDEHTRRYNKFHLPPPQEVAFSSAHNVESCAGTAIENGLVLRLAVNRQGELVTTDLTINPVAAAALLAIIRDGGNALGWLDANGDVVTTGKQ